MIHKKAGLFFILTILVAFAVISFSSEASGGAVTAEDTPIAVELTGWLLDKCCGETKDPANHSVECLRMKSCAATGYGILVIQPDGTHKFYKFDEDGHNLAVEALKKVTQKDNLTLTVKGIRDGVLLKVTTIVFNNN